MASQVMLPAVDGLLSKWIEVADVVVTSAQEVQSRLRSEPLERALRGVRLLARTHAAQVLAVGRNWRASKQLENKARPGTERTPVVDRTAAVDIMFLKLLMQLVDEWCSETQPVNMTQARALQEDVLEIGFTWLALPEDKLPQKAAVRNTILSVSATAIGCVSRLDLNAVMTRFLSEIKERINPSKAPGAKVNHDVVRAQAMRLCDAVSCLELRFSTPEQVNVSTDYLKRLFPLQPTLTAPIRKSQVHHAIADAMTTALWPLVRAGLPYGGKPIESTAALEQWNRTVTQYRTEALTWLNKHDKHKASVTPLVTVLVCLMEEREYAANVDVQLDAVLKGLHKGGKELRPLYVRCIALLVTSYLTRYGKRMPRHELNKWLHKTYTQDNKLLSLAKKGGLSIQELKDLMEPIASLAPEYAVSSVVLDLLASDVYECTMAGLQMLHTILLSAGSAADASGPSSGDMSAAMRSNPSSVPPSPTGSPQVYQGQQQTPGTSGLFSAAHGGGSSSGGLVHVGGDPAALRAISGRATVLDAMRRGQHPLDTLGLSGLQPKVHAALSRMLSQWHAMYGPSATFYGNESSRPQGLQLFRELLVLVPYVRPELWSPAKPHVLDVLPEYTRHADPLIREAATDALHCMMFSSPHLRNTLLASIAAYLGSLADHSVAPMSQGLALLRSLASSWSTILGQRAAGEVVEMSGPEALVLDLHRLEGLGLALLCSFDDGVRKEVLQLLPQLRTLHCLLLSAQPYMNASASASSPAPSQSAAMPCLPSRLGSAPPACSSSPTALWPSTATQAKTVSRMGSGERGASSCAPASQLQHAAALLSVAPSSGSSVHRGGGMPRTASTGFIPGHVGGSHHQRHFSRDSVDSLMDAAQRFGPSSLSLGQASTLGVLDAQLAASAYLMDVLEQEGPDIVRSCYWDWGEFSDLWRHYQPVPEETPTLVKLLSTSTSDRDPMACVRLCRCLIELAKTVSHMSPATAAHAQAELSVRLVRLLAKDSSQRVALCPDHFESARSIHSWCQGAAVAVALPTSVRDRMADVIHHQRQPQGSTAPRPASVAKQLPKARMLIAAHVVHVATEFPNAPPSFAISTTLALGHAHPEHYDALLDELWPLVEEYGRAPTKQKSTLLNFLENTPDPRAGVRMKPEGLRRAVANVLRVMTAHAPPKQLSGRLSVYSRLMDWLRDTFLLIKLMVFEGDALGERGQVAYCLACVVRSVARPLLQQLSQPLATICEDVGRSLATVSTRSGGTAYEGPSGSGTAPAGTRQLDAWKAANGGTALRKLLFECMMTLSQEGYQDERMHANAIRASVEASIERMKAASKVEVASQVQNRVRTEMQVFAHVLDHAARLAMAELLWSPVFDADVRRPQGMVLTWIDRLLRAGGVADMQASAVQGKAEVLGPAAAHARIASLANGHASSSSAVGKDPATGPSKREVGRQALLNLLQGNLDNVDLLRTCLDRCYDKDRAVAAGFFQVLCEVYSTYSSVRFEPHLLLSLILYKMVDSIQEVREDALHLLHVLSNREWHAPGPFAPSSSVTPPLCEGSPGVGRGNRGEGAQARAGSSSAVPAAASPLGLSPLSTPGRSSYADGAVLRQQGADGSPSVESTPDTLGPLPGARVPVGSPGMGSMGLHAAGSPGFGQEGGPGALGSEWDVEEDPNDVVVVLGSLQDSYQQFQNELSIKLAKDHPELSEDLCEEMMTRQLDCTDSVIQHPVLICLAPWMENLSIHPNWKDKWSERLLKSMYYVTQSHGHAFPVEVERLWSTLASNKRNIIPILDFLISLGMRSALQDLTDTLKYFHVGKRIALYLARVSPQQTMDHLVYEISQQVLEEDNPAPSNRSMGGASDPALASCTHEFDSWTLSEPSTSSAVPWFTSQVSMDLLPANSTGSESAFNTGQGRSSSTTLVPAVSASADSAMLGGLGGGFQQQEQHGAGVRGTDGGTSARTTRSAEGLVAQAAGGAVQGQWSRAQGGDASSLPAVGASGGAPGSTGMAGGGPGGPASNHGDRSSERVGVVSKSEGSMRSETSTVLSSTNDSAILGPPKPAGPGPSHLQESFLSHTTMMLQLSEAQAPANSQGSSSHMVVAGGSVHGNPAGGGGPVGGPPAAAGVRALLTRPELALCLLTEVAYEHDEDFRTHLALLMHCCVLVMDHDESFVHSHGQQLMVNLLYSLSARELENAGQEGRPANHAICTSLIRYMLSMRGRRHWPWEDSGLRLRHPPSEGALASLVESVVSAMHWEEDLEAYWADVALEWALHCRSRHLSSRSFQVFRALRPTLSAAVCSTLLQCLHQCFVVAAPANPTLEHTASFKSGPGGVGRPDPALGRDTAVEVVSTLKSMVDTLQPGRLMVYPQLFWAGLVLLHTRHVGMYAHALGLLSSVLSGLRLHLAKVQNVVLASAPGGQGHALLLYSQAHGVSSGSNSQRSGCEEAELWLVGLHVLGLDNSLAPSFDLTMQPQVRHYSLAVQQLLLRGLTQAETQAPSLMVLAQLAEVLELHGRSESRRWELGAASAGLPPALAKMPASGSATPGGQGPSSGSGFTEAGQAALALAAVQQRAARLAGGLPGAGTAGSGLPPLPPGGRPSASGTGLGGDASGALRSSAQASASDRWKEAVEMEDEAAAATIGLVAPAGRSAQVLSGGADSSLGPPSASSASGLASRPGGAGSSLKLGPHYESLRKHRDLHLDSFRALLGPWRSQLFVSLMGLLPLLLARLGAGAATAGLYTHAPPPAGQHSAKHAAHPQQGSEGGDAGAQPCRSAVPLIDAVTAVARAAAAHGLTALGARLMHLATLEPGVGASNPGALDRSLLALCYHISRAFFPQYSAWFFHTCVDLLDPLVPACHGAHHHHNGSSGHAAAAATMAAAQRRQAAALLALLRGMLLVPDMPLNAPARALLGSKSVAELLALLSQGPLSQAALEASAVVISISQSGDSDTGNGMSAPRRGPSPTRRADSGAMSEGSASRADEGGNDGGRAEKAVGSEDGDDRTAPVLRTLMPPPHPVDVALRKVIDTLGSSALRRRRALKLMPFLAGGTLGSSMRHVQIPR